MILYKKSVYLIGILLAAVFIIAIFQFLRIIPGSDSGSAYVLADPELIEGKRLSEIYCTSCHTRPDPGLLPKNIWVSDIFPEMGPLLGVYQHNGVQYNFMQNRSQLQHLPPDYYPAEPLLGSDEWQKIIDYYMYAAPEILVPAQKDPGIIRDSTFFMAHIPDYHPERTPNVAAVKFDPEKRLIYISEANENKIMVFDKNLVLKNMMGVHSLVVDIGFLDTPGHSGIRSMHLTSIGSFEPSDEPLGSLSKGWYNPEAGEYDLQSHMIMDSLTRPVETQFKDINGNGLDDLVIAEFGHRTGSLFWLKNTGNGFDPQRNVLIDSPGCIQTHVSDLTGNGLNDITALCTQVDQSIYLLENQGGGKFTTRRLLQFDITAGSSSFDLHDFNNDGHPDILYTSGDNADYSKVYKSYHGVTIFLNDGEFNFSRKWFYPVNGAYRAIAADFNNNGLPDIAAIAYFPDFNRTPEEGFLFFKNEGGLTFTPYHHPAAGAGRWLAMDVADWTGNGYPDILLGSFPDGPSTPGPLNLQPWQDAPPFLLLENRFDEQ